MRTRGGQRRLLPVALVAFCVIGPGAGRRLARSGEERATETRAARPRGVDCRDVGDVVRTVERWVVALRVVRTKDLPRPRSRFVLRAPPQFLSPEAKDYEKRPAGYVTGLLVDAEGHVLTSYYNVAGSITSIEVVLPAGEKRSARIVATDEVDDLALLRVEGDALVVPGAEWQDPPWETRVPRAGRMVLAVGRSPDPERLTVTQGIVSAVGRNGGRAFQTDAEMNYGNVGGPLLDLDGRILGVGCFVGHTQPQWGVNSGIGFGTTVAVIRDILPRLRQGEKIGPPVVPLLGVQPGPNDLDVEGAPILLVVAKSAADRAGVKSGDVVVEYDGRRIDTFNQLRRVIYCGKVSESVLMKVRRGEETLELRVTLGRRDP